MLSPDGLSNFRAIVLDLVVWLGGDIRAHTVPGSNKYHIEFATFNFSREGTLPRADCKNRIVVVPPEGNYRMPALLVFIAVAGIFVQIEAAVGAPIDAQFNRAGGIVCGVLEWTTTESSDGVATRSSGLHGS